MGRVPPFLSLNDKIQYLETKGYLSSESILVEDRANGYGRSNF